jgi:membrane protease YdiL (CAAX protease family)
VKVLVEGGGVKEIGGHGGLRRGNLGKGMGWALLLGAAFGFVQIFLSGNSAETQEAIRSGRALYLLPLGFVLMMMLAGFTEEFFFRGFLQTRAVALLRSKWLAVVIVALLFGVYHLPYAYFNPHWPSAGDWGAAWFAALGNGVPGGLVLGALYVKSNRNLVACIVLHSMIGAFPAMTALKFGG